MAQQQEELGPSPISPFDLEDLDPSLVNGYSLFYEREVPLEIRSAQGIDMPTEIGALEAIRVKILVKGSPEQLESVKVELASESNLFFHYVHEMDAAAFEKMRDSQRLMMEFFDYPTVLLRMLNQCIREPHIHLAVFVMQPTGEARLDFIQNMEYKFVELLSCNFFASDEDVVRAQVSYRYNVVKARMQLLQARLSDINQMVKIKNPGLLMQLQRTPPTFPSPNGKVPSSLALGAQAQREEGPAAELHPGLELGLIDDVGLGSLAQRGTGRERERGGSSSGAASRSGAGPFR